MPSQLVTYLDVGGDFVEGVFYNLEVPFLFDDLDLYCTPPRVDEGDPAQWILSLPKDRQKSPAHCTLRHGAKWKSHCPTQRDHHAVEYYYSKMMVVYRPGDVLYDFIWIEGDVVGVTSKLRSFLRRGGLTGFRTRQLDLDVERPEITLPKLYWLVMTSARCVREYETILPKHNVCPFCEQGPVVCPYCGFVSGVCDTCGETIVVDESEHGGAEDPRFFERGPAKIPLIIDGARWDGSDFIDGMWGASCFVTRRVVDFLLSIDAKPFVAKPVRVDVRGCSAEQLEWLERARGM